MTRTFIPLKLLDYLLSISMHDINLELTTFPCASSIRVRLGFGSCFFFFKIPQGKARNNNKLNPYVAHGWKRGYHL